MKKIELTNGGYTSVSDADFRSVSKWKWFKNQAGYVNGRIYKKDGSKKKVLLHRWILSAPKGSIIDHIDRDKLNNQRENLRFCTHSQNSANKGKTKSITSSKYIGVSWYALTNRWNAQISHKDKYYSLGYYEDEDQAARIRDIAAKVLNEEYAIINIPDIEYTEDEINYVNAKLSGNPYARFIDGKSVKSSNYIGVSFNKRHKDWMAYIRKQGKGKYVLGHYKAEKDAAIARDCAEYLLKRRRAKLNFPEKHYSISEIRKIFKKIKDINQKELTSIYRGVSFRHEKWRTLIRYNDKDYHLGSFDDEIDAARAYDAALIYLYPDKVHLTNFSYNTYNDDDIQIAKDKIHASDNRTYGSIYRGVTIMDGRYRVAIEIADESKKKGFRKISFGIYDDEIMAAKTYDAAYLHFYGDQKRVNFPVEPEYSDKVQAIFQNAKERDSRRSEYKGVGFHKRRNKWQSNYRTKGKAKHIGYFNNEIDAALAYNIKVVEIYGNDAKINLIESLV